MHYGTVNDALETVVSLVILKDDGTDETLDFIVDTGLSEEMVLPQPVIDRLGLRPDDRIPIMTGDGRGQFVGTYHARVLWHARPQGIHVASMGREFLIGMALFRGSNVNIDAVPGGSVTITELSAAP